ncbi:hypothetical protein LJR034_008769 [Caballeronia sp. LjRoot34]|uniref:hypothetical protein n=1 Tax=Caballeronia sp. LjRoot34 TaxID=3342325 RepID=UPI003ECE10D6
MALRAAQRVHFYILINLSHVRSLISAGRSCGPHRQRKAQTPDAKIWMMLISRELLQGAFSRLSQFVGTLLGWAVGFLACRGRSCELPVKDDLATIQRRFAADIKYARKIDHE